MKKSLPKLIGLYLNQVARFAPLHAGRLGFRLFCRPSPAPIEPRHKAFLSTSEDCSFSYEGQAIRGYRWGSGARNVVLLHGWQSHSARWKDLVEALPESEYSVYAIDAPGHGLSAGSFFTGPLYGEIACDLAGRIGKVHATIGHSIGAFSMLYALSTFKQMDVDRAVVMATPGQMSDFVTYFRKKMSLKADAMDAIRAHFEREMGKPYEHFSITQFAESLDIPGLILHDPKDVRTPFRYAELLHERWEESTLLPIDGTGHALQSSTVLEQTLRFISQKTVEIPGAPPQKDYEIPFISK